MKWTIISKVAENCPTTGSYRNWKPALAEEGGHRCVYCALSEARFGGEYNFHVEHFEPQSRAPSRINDWENLFFACGICNVLKSNDFPTDVDRQYINPSEVDYGSLIQVSEHFELLPASTNLIERTRYMIERLYLNRPQLVVARRYASLKDSFRQLISVIEQISPESAADPEILSLLLAFVSLTKRIDRFDEHPYYTASDRSRSVTST